MLIRPAREFIEVPVCDLLDAEGNVIAKQMLRFLNKFISSESETGEIYILVKTRLDRYLAQEDGSYGPLLTNKGFTPRIVELVADSNAAVNLATGEIIMRDTRTAEQKLAGVDAPTQEVWEAELEADPQPWILQSDYFANIMHHHQVGITAMLLDFMVMANEPPFNKCA